MPALAEGGLPEEPGELSAITVKERAPDGEPKGQLPAKGNLEDMAMASTEDILNAAGSVEIVDEVDLEEEVERSKKIKERATLIVEDMLLDVRSGKAVNSAPAYDMVNEMVESIFRNQDALVSLTRLKSYDDYTFSHSINVSILSVSLGRQFGFTQDEVLELGVGAVLHDIGKMLVPNALLNKPGIFTDEEYKEMKRHPELGSEFLENTKGIKEPSIAITRGHHERYDGSGYPDKHAKSSIHIFARLVGVTDTYDAMTSKRVYQRRSTPNNALGRMYKGKGTHFDPFILERLVQTLGIYPIGSLVELNTGEAGVVLSVNRDDLLTPVVQVLFDGGKAPLSRPRKVELRRGGDRWITGGGEPHKYNLDPDREIGNIGQI